MELIDASKPDDFYDGDLSWINFQGRWGNIQQIVSCCIGCYLLNMIYVNCITIIIYMLFAYDIAIFQHCELEPIVGECGLVGGVGGPGTDFGMNHFGDPDCSKNLKYS